MDDRDRIEELLTPDPWRATPAKRVVWYTNESFYDVDTGKYVVARITEDERGYEVWDRFATLEDAKAATATANRTHGLGDGDVLAVVASSMRAGRVEEVHEYIVTFEIDEITAPSHEAAAQQVADMLGGDYAQRATYSVRQNGDPDWKVEHIDLSGEES